MRLPVCSMSIPTEFAGPCSIPASMPDIRPSSARPPGVRARTKRRQRTGRENSAAAWWRLTTFLICGWMIHSKDGTPMKMAPHPALASGTVNHVGDAVAVVIGETLALARDAAEKVKVDYEVL